MLSRVILRVTRSGISPTAPLSTVIINLPQPSEHSPGSMILSVYECKKVQRAYRGTSEDRSADWKRYPSTGSVCGSAV